MEDVFSFTKEDYASSKEVGLTSRQKAIFRLLNQQIVMHMFISEANVRIQSENVKRQIDYNREQAVVITDVL